jgi:YVTN family beta-propeller protein
MRVLLRHVFLGMCACLAISWAWADDYEQSRVGELDDGRVVVPTNQVLSPAGEQLFIEGRPNDLALSPDHRWLAVLNAEGVILIDVEARRVADRVQHRFGAASGILFSTDGQRLYASNPKGQVSVFEVTAGRLVQGGAIVIPARTGSALKSSLPTGLALSADGGTLYVALNGNNSLGEIDLQSGQIKREVNVGSAPYGVAVVGNKAYVSNWGGRRPGTDDPMGPAGAGSPVRVDPVRHIANDGSVSVIDLASGRPSKEIVVGLHPSGIAATPDGRHVVVACANSDRVDVIDAQTDELIESIGTAPAEKLLFGSSPNAVAISRDGNWLYVANGTNNSIALVEFKPRQSRLAGCVPTGWYPSGVVLDPSRQAIYVTNVKGHGSRDPMKWATRRASGERPAYAARDFVGTVSFIPVPSGSELAQQTAQVAENNRQTEAINALAPPRKEVAPRPLPARHGEPSVFKHVLYIIKENRTYDQVFGDLEQGEGDPELCIFGREVTPNHHKLAEEFVLLDNFYCSGALSADGHQWTSEAFATDYIEKSFGDFPRSYPYDGDDALAYAPTGFIWDNVLAHGKSLRVYGEFVSAQIRWKDPAKSGRPSFMDCYQDFLQKTGLIEVQAKANIKTLEPYLCPTAIGFPSIVPDIHRAEQFVQELKGFEARGEFPNFSIMLLPNDHTAGTRAGMPTPAAAVADNDLALGRIVEAVSHSKFWKETCIFVVEDDPQAGFDHIDGHRTVAMVISPYTRRRSVDRTNYNQTSMVRTMELILGLPPMNQLDSSATPMASCFSEQFDPTPYVSMPNRIPLDQLNPEPSAINDPAGRRWAELSMQLPLDDIDEADEDTLNRILWYAQRGRDDTYPAWAAIAQADEDDDD